MVGGHSLCDLNACRRVEICFSVRTVVAPLVDGPRCWVECASTQHGSKAGGLVVARVFDVLVDFLCSLTTEKN